MSRLSRVVYKLFGSSGPADDFAKFGSQTAGAPVKTKDIALIQSLSAWDSGWKAAIVAANRAPFLEDANAIEYVHGYMLAYLMQDGVPEWNANTEYHQNSIVKKSGTYELYASLTNTNTGNALPVQTDDTNWKFLFPVRASTLIGMVADGQITGLSTSKLTGLILNAQIDAVAASKLTGTVADGQIAGMSATKIIGAILDAQITSLSASKLTGTITPSDNSVTSAKIVSGAAANAFFGFTYNSFAFSDPGPVNRVGGALASVTVENGDVVVADGHVCVYWQASAPGSGLFIYLKRDGAVVQRGLYMPKVAAGDWLCAVLPIRWVDRASGGFPYQIAAGVHTYDLWYTLQYANTPTLYNSGILVTQHKKCGSTAIF